MTLIQAARDGGISAALVFLEALSSSEKLAALSEKNEFGQTPLHWAMEKGNDDLTIALLDTYPTLEDQFEAITLPDSRKHSVFMDTLQDSMIASDELRRKIKSIVLNYLKIDLPHFIALNLSDKLLFGKYLVTEDREGFEKLALQHSLFLQNQIPNPLKKELLQYAVFFMFPSLSNKEVPEYIKNVLQSIPDEIMPLNEKLNFVESLPFVDKKFIYKISYTESPPALKSQNIISKISLTHYRAALKSNPDYSDFIILTYGLLQSLATEPHDPWLGNSFNEIAKNYFSLNFEKCLNDIISVAERLFQTNILDSENFNLINQSLQHCKEVNIETNYTRRFYELKMSQYLVGQAEHNEKMESLNRMGSFYGLAKITTLDEAEVATEILSELKDYSLLQRMDDFKNVSSKYQFRRIFIRPGFLTKTEELAVSNSLANSTYSMNFSGMKTNAPNFVDHIARYRMRNRTVDIRSSSLDSYSSLENRNRANYVGSISGHAFFFIAVCERYIMAQNQTLQGRYDQAIIDNMINQDIRNILAIFIGYYIKKGYHGLQELIDPFLEPKIINYFLHNFRIDIVPSIDPLILKWTMNDTLTYSKGLMLQKALHNELLSFPQLLKRLKNQTEPQRLKILNTPNQFAGHTLLTHAAIRGDIRTVQAILDSLPILFTKAKDRNTVITTKNANELTALMCAARGGQIEVVWALLNALPENERLAAISITEPNGQNAFYDAACSSYHNIMLVFLESIFGKDRWLIAMNPFFNCFIYAAFMGEISICNSLLQGLVGISDIEKLTYINTKGSLPDEQTALICAAKQGHYDIVEAILNSVSLDIQSQIINLPDALGKTPLMHAVENGHLKIVQYLISRGADLTITTPQGETAYTFGLNTGSANACALLVKEHLNKLLIIALENMNGAEIKKLIEVGADINIQTSQGYTALMTACILEDKTLMTTLLIADADPSIRNAAAKTAYDLGQSSDSPLSLESLQYFKKLLEVTFISALENRDILKIKQILNSGANIDVVNQESKENWTALALAAELGDLECVINLLRMGCDVNQACTDGGSPLFMAARAGHLEIFDTLIRSGADLTCKLNNLDMTVLMVAASFGQLSILQYILDLKNGKDEIDLQDAMGGDTALTMACYVGNIVIVRALLSAGADVTVKNSEGKTAYQIARDLHYSDCQEAIQTHLNQLLMSALESNNFHKIDGLIDAGADSSLIPTQPERRRKWFNSYAPVGSTSLSNSRDEVLSIIEFYQKELASLSLDLQTEDYLQFKKLQDCLPSSEITPEMAPAILENLEKMAQSIQLESLTNDKLKQILLHIEHRSNNSPKV